MWRTGWLSDWLFKKTRNIRVSRSYLIAFSQLAAAMAILPLLGNVDKYTAIIFISIAVSFSMNANYAYYAINIDIAKERAGTALGIMGAFFAASGLLVPAMTDWVVQHSNNFKRAFILLIILGLSSVIAILFSYPDKEKRLSEL
jgi:MFS transporter, ACS family, hexuronate transporter